MRSNCLIVAVTAVVRAHRRGRSKPGAEVHLWLRLSRERRVVIHVGWQQNDPRTGGIKWRRSFKPFALCDAPWWAPWRCWIFDGRVVRDDPL